MEGSGKVGVVMSNIVRKKRSQRFRNPQLDSQACGDDHENSSLSSTPPWDEGSKVSSDEDNGVGSRKEMSLNHCISGFRAENEKPSKRSRKEDVRLDLLYANTDSMVADSVLSHKRSSEVVAPADRKSSSTEKRCLESVPSTMPVPSESGHDGTGNETKVKRVTFKVGGVIRTITANSAGKSSRSCETFVPQPKLMLKDDRSSRDKTSSRLQGIPWKDFSMGGFTLGKEGFSVERASGKSQSRKQGEKSDPVRKSRRAAKKHAVGGAFDDEDDDDEIRYLEKLKNSKLTSGYKDDDESSKKHQRLSKVSGICSDGNRKSSYGVIDYEEEENPTSDGGIDGAANKKPKKEPPNSDVEPKREMSLTTRRRALQSGEDPSAGLMELPPAPSRKKKVMLTDLEQQTKKAEAAKRRRMQNEKAERESQEEAIRKILGQDSSRLKREEKKKRRQEDLAKEKAAEALRRASNSIRSVMGPNGTTVTFPYEMGLPDIFNSKPDGYPPPRETCAGPSCSNPYKYRDSKTMLPLCSLQCYKLVQANKQSEETRTPIGDIPVY